MRKRSAFLAFVIAGLAAFAWSGTRPPLGAAPATAGDCVTIGVWSNGWHTSYSIPADLLPADHPLRRLYPQARWLLVGWGDSGFYQSDGTDLLLGLKALLPGGDTVMHVIGRQRPVEESFIPAEMAYLGVSRAGAAALADRLAESLDLQADGAVKIVAPGQHGAGSVFLAARGAFDLFQVCNHWTARGLRRAGVDLNAAFVYRGEWLTAAARAKAPACGAVATSPGTM
jgi:uncharacterized protein (TIGR02117 family)